MAISRPRLVALAATTALASMAAACGGQTPRESSLSAPSAESPAEAVERWRAKHEADYRREYSTIAGLHALKPGPNTTGSAATNDVVLPASTPASLGRFVLTNGQVRFEPAPAAPVLLREKPLTSPIDLRSDEGPDVDELTIGEVRIVVHVTGTDPMIRVRDPNSPEAKGFLGFAWFPLDARYRVIGRFIKDPEPRRAKVINTYGDLDEYTTEGVVEFTLFGQTLRLRPFTTRPERFYFVFKDASSGVETYQAARFLYSDLLDDGTTVLEFNEAYNPPCAFNPYTTCPIPLPENRLPIKILAGEKAYPVHVPLPSRSAR